MRKVNCKAKDNGRVIEWDMRTPRGLLELGSDDLDDYLDLIDSFYVERLRSTEICMTVRKEVRSGSVCWYASKRFAGKLYKTYVGQQITRDLLWRAATKLPTDAHIYKVIETKK